MKRRLNENIEIGDEVYVTRDEYKGTVIDINGDEVLIDGPFGEEYFDINDLEKIWGDYEEEDLAPSFGQNFMESRKKIIRLTERDLTRIVRRVINENNDPFSSMYGKKAIFEPTGDIDDIVIKSFDYKDEWNGFELENESMSSFDEELWESSKLDSIKGTIKKITPVTQDSLRIEIAPLNTSIREYRQDIVIYYDCGSNEFDILFNFYKYGGDSFFSEKQFRGTYTCDQFSEYLNNHLPCGGFDLSKSDSMDDEDFGDTLS